LTIQEFKARSLTGYHWMAKFIGANGSGSQMSTI
jgi:hypothetical protein